MARLQLLFQPTLSQFRLRVGVELPSLGRRTTAEMILDSGTNRSAISETVAARLGAEIDHLESVDIGGVTSIEGRPRLPDVALWIVGEDFARIVLSEVLVLRDLRRKEKTRKGGWQARPAARLEAPCLFGMDALAALNGRAVLNPSKGEGWLEW